MNKISKNSWWIVIILGMIFFCPQISHAEKSKITVDRSIIDLGGQTGESADFSFRLRNDSKADQRINIEIRDIDFSDDNKFSFVDVPGGPSSWVSFSDNDFVMKSDEEKTVSGAVDFSQENQEKSSYYMLAMVSFRPEEEIEAVGPQIHGNIGIYVLARRGDGQDASGKIMDISFPEFVSRKNELKLIYENVGNRYFIPKTKASIRNIFGGEVKNIPLEKRFVFPGKKVSFSSEIEDISPWGFFHLQVKFEDGNGKTEKRNLFALGRFFPIGFAAFLIMMVMLLIFIIRKRNQVRIEILEKS